MTFNIENYPEYAAIEQHIRRAKAERAVYIADLLARAVASASRGIRQFAAGIRHGVKLEPTPRY